MNLLEQISRIHVMMEVNKNNDLPIIAKRRYPEIMKLLKKVMSNTYPENYDDFLQYKTEILSKIIIKYILEHSYEEAIQITEIINGYFIDEIENFYNESTNKIHEMVGVISENNILNFFHNKFNKIFDKLELIKTEDNLHQYNWIDNDGKKVFERNHWGMFWIYGCDEYYRLKNIPKMAGLSFLEFENILIEYLNNRYNVQFGDEKPLQNIATEVCDEY